MKKHLGILFFDTSTYLQKIINKHNYHILKDQFDTIIIVDIVNEYSISLKKELNVDTYVLIKNFMYKKIDIQLYVYQMIEHDKYDYITWIDNSNIFIHKISNYLNYISDHHFYTLMDKFENGNYSYSLHMYSLHFSCIGKYICFLKRIRNTQSKETQMWEIMNKDILNLFPNRTPFLKFGYNEEMFDKDIFLEIDSFYKRLIELEVLPYISIESLIKRREVYKSFKYTGIPSHFDINIYKQHKDLEETLKTNESYYEHFLQHGQFEMRIFSSEIDYILPTFIREYLIKYNLIDYFDINKDFNLMEYKNSVKDVVFHNLKDYVVYWLENRIFNAK